MASRDPKDLSLEMRIKLMEFLARAREEGVDVLIYHTFRTDSEQAELWAKGRTKPGPKVTWTRVSKHQRRERGVPASDAWDCVPMVLGKCAWEDREKYLILGRIAKEIGLRWGGNWDSDDKPGEPGENDSPHFELIR